MRTAKHSVVGRTDLHQSVRPFRQGSLDAYCGFYAIANAMLKIKPEAFREHESSSNLLRVMMKAAARICTPEELIGEGMDGVELEYVARAAIRHMNRLGHEFQPVRPSRLGLGPIGRDHVKWFADAAAMASVAVIVYVDEGEQSHWSVLKETLGNRVLLFDSDGMRSAKIAQCQPHLVVNWRDISGHSSLRP